MRTEPSHTVRIHVAGSYRDAVAACRSFCDRVGLCVTVTPTAFAYTGGVERGVTVGLENYPRFPKPPDVIDAIAISLAAELRDRLGQRTALVVGPVRTVWLGGAPVQKSPFAHDSP